MASVNEEVRIDKRQVSIELFMKNLPCTSDVLIGSGDFYQLAIPKLSTDNLNLKGSWDSRPVLLTGKIVSLSEPFYLSDIKTFSCTNPRCRNNSRVIRHVGFDHLEHVEELGSEQLKPEVFVSGSRKSSPVVKCHNCREEISELYPFRSNLEFKLVKLKIKDSFLTVNVLLCGSKTCSMVKMSGLVSLIGFPKLTVEVPIQLKQITAKLSSLFYFEVYGVEREICGSTISMKETLNVLISCTGELLRFPLLLLLCQLIGSANSIKLDLCLSGIDHCITNRLLNIFNNIFGSIDSDVMGHVANNPQKVSGKSKGIKVVDESLPYYINITDANCIKDENKSILYTKYSHDQVVTIPIDLSTSEEADILLNHQVTQKVIPVPALNSEISLSNYAVKRIHAHFLRLRKRLQGSIPLQFTLDLLTKLTQISAAASKRTEALEEDAEFAIMLHAKILIYQQYDDVDSYDQNQIMMMSPSMSFEFDHGDTNTFNDLKSSKLAEYYGLNLN